MSYQGCTRPDYGEYLARSAYRARGCAVVVTCTDGSHDDLRIELADTLADRMPLNTLTSARAAQWLRTMRQWPGADLTIGECTCGSTIAIETKEIP